MQRPQKWSDEVDIHPIRTPADYEAALANFTSVEETKRVSALLEARRTDLEGLMAEWEEVGQSIEANR